jgi:hypothetical protein
MYGIGVGIVLAITYPVAISIVAALGTGGLVTPALAARGICFSQSGREPEEYSVVLRSRFSVPGSCSRFGF